MHLFHSREKETRNLSFRYFHQMNHFLDRPDDTRSSVEFNRLVETGKTQGFENLAVLFGAPDGAPDQLDLNRLCHLRFLTERFSGDGTRSGEYGF